MNAVSYHKRLFPFVRILLAFVLLLVLIDRATAQESFYKGKPMNQPAEVVEQIKKLFVQQ